MQMHMYDWIIRIGTNVEVTLQMCAVHEILSRKTHFALVLNLILDSGCVLVCDSGSVLVCDSGTVLV